MSRLLGMMPSIELKVGMKDIGNYGVSDGVKEGSAESANKST